MKIKNLKYVFAYKFLKYFRAIAVSLDFNTIIKIFKTAKVCFI